MVKVLIVEQYSPYYIVVKGETPEELEKRSIKLNELGGVFKETLLDRNGSTHQGWLFLKHKEKYVSDYVDWVNYYHNEKLIDHLHLHQYL